MRNTCVFAFIQGALTAGIASPQYTPANLVNYLNLTASQYQPINSLDITFNQYSTAQQSQWYQLQSQAYAELAQGSPDPNVVGSYLAQMEMITRDYNTQLAQLQSSVAAILTPDQLTLVSGLLNVVRLQSLVSEAQCVYMEPYSRLQLPPSVAAVGSTASGSCSPIPLPTALVNYLNLSDGQVSSIESAIQGNQDYVNRRSLKIQKLQDEIQKLTSAQTIDTAKLGTDYIAIAQIESDETSRSQQLENTVRSVLTNQQQPQLTALDNAIALNDTANAAVSASILVLPPDFSQSCPFPAVRAYGSTACVLFAPESNGNASDLSAPTRPAKVY